MERELCEQIKQHGLNKNKGTSEEQLKKEMAKKMKKNELVETLYTRLQKELKLEIFIWYLGLTDIYNNSIDKGVIDIDEVKQIVNQLKCGSSEVS